MAKIVLIRPGATDYDDEDRIRGTLNLPLSERGSDEVRRSIADLRSLGIEMIYSSTCEPALETAEIIAKALEVKLRKLSNVQNLDHGLWQGMCLDEVKRKYPKVYREWQEHPESVCPPEGETVFVARERAELALRKILRKNKAQTIGLVIPEPLASMVSCQLRNAPLGNLWEASRAHGSWEVIDLEQENIVLSNRA